MTFATLTPTRGDRKELFQFCRGQLDRQTLQPQKRYYIFFSPSDNKPDLVKRVKNGIELARQDGIEYVFMVEDDDFYPENYFESIKLDFDFFGYSDTIYYNLRNRTYAEFKHQNRASLFCTAFKVSALDRFTWPKDDSIFLDLKIWDFANRKSKKIRLLRGNPCLGVKHNIGMTGGKAHKWTMKNADHDLSFLRSRVDDVAFEFYSDLMKRL